MKRSILLFVAFFYTACFSANAQTPVCQPNLDMELGNYSNWLLQLGTCCPISTPTVTTAPGTRFTVTSGSTMDACCSFPVVGAGIYSMKIGSAVTNYLAEKATYYVHVPTTPGNYTLVYRYAFVLQDPSHMPASQPRFEVSAIDSNTGATIPSGTFTSIAGTVPGTYYVTCGAVSTSCKSWTTRTIDLTGYNGSTIIVNSSAGDCGLGGHYGYAYIDMSCGLFITNSVPPCGSSTIQLSAPTGFASYAWYDSASFTTSYGTTATITVPVPSVATQYAVIIIPAPGFGNPDTLYTTVNAASCSGIPVAGTVAASTYTVCAASSVTVTNVGFSATTDHQWQSSPDSLTWTNISGATGVNYFTSGITTTTYFRCKDSCCSSGLTAVTPGVKITLTNCYHIIADSIVSPPDTLCNAPKFYIKVSGVSSLLQVITYFGDGFNNNIPLISSGGTSYANATHSYATPGCYTIKQVLLYNSLPVDSITFLYHQNYCRTFLLKFYYDANGDCIKNTTESFNSIPVSVRVDSAGIPVATLSATAGLYYIAKGGPGTIYSFNFLPGTTYASCPSTGVFYDTILPTAASYPINYFGLSCSSSTAYDLGLNRVLLFTRGYHQAANIFPYNTECTPVNAAVTVYFSPKYVYTGEATPAPSSVSGNSLSWNISNLNYGYSGHIYYRVENSPVTGHLYAGDTVYSLYTITPTSGDYNLANNTRNICDTVTSSGDPNEMSVSPKNCFLSDTSLEYTIHFENTGNDTAHNIHVMDTLSANLDITNLKVIMASAEMDIVQYTDGPYNIVKFDFPNINLLDSSHHDQCDGAVIFTVKTLPGLADGSTIFNRVGIYFDDNDVVMTNTVENIKGCFPDAVPVVKQTHKVDIYPNPATNELTIKMEAGAYNSYTITNNVGQVLITKSLDKATTKVNIKALPAGLYYITVKGDNGSTVQKFVKM